jgi:hypothetical protein
MENGSSDLASFGTDERARIWDVFERAGLIDARAMQHRALLYFNVRSSAPWASVLTGKWLPPRL